MESADRVVPVMSHPAIHEPFPVDDAERGLRTGPRPRARRSPAPEPPPEPTASPVSNQSARIDDAIVERFRRDGVAHLDGAFHRVGRGCSAPASSATCARPDPTRRSTSRKARRVTSSATTATGARIPEYRDFVLHSPAAAMAARLMESRTARFFHEHVLVKEPETESRTPWHHDLPYYCIDGTRTVSFWTALDPVPRPVCLELVVGSHRWGKSFLPKKFAGYRLRARGRGAGYDAGHGRAPRRIRDRLVRHGAGRRHRLPLPHLVHGAPGNASKSARRRAFAHRWVGDDVRFKLRGGEVSPPFPEAHRRLRDGDLLEGPEFPLVWAGGGVSRGTATAISAGASLSRTAGACAS